MTRFRDGLGREPDRARGATLQCGATSAGPRACPVTRSGRVVPTRGNHTDGGGLMPSKRHHALWAFLVAGLGLLGPSMARAQEPDTEFRSGVAAFEEGRFEEAEVHFRNVL